MSHNHYNQVIFAFSLCLTLTALVGACSSGSNKAVFGSGAGGVLGGKTDKTDNRGADQRGADQSTTQSTSNPEGGAAQSGAGEEGQGPSTGSPSPPGGQDPNSSGDPKKLELVETLIWKRHRPFEQTLIQALELSKEQLCNELGQFSCVDVVHLTLLGGNEPFINGQHERADRPTVLTPLTVERIVLTACSQRLQLDQGSPSQKAVFKQLNLAGSTASVEDVKSQANNLYQRFYGRDANPNELAAAAEILKITSAPEKIAIGLCLAIGSTIENVFL